jgi:hypothetical protein
MPIKKVKAQPRRSLRKFEVGSGLPALISLKAEFVDYWDILLGRAEPPFWNGVATLMEVADAYYARAAEVTALIQEAERLKMSTPAYTKFRTGSLRTFMEMAKRAADLGSRRITLEQMTYDRERLGRESG